MLGHTTEGAAKPFRLQEMQAVFWSWFWTNTTSLTLETEIIIQQKISVQIEKSWVVYS